MHHYLALAYLLNVVVKEYLKRRFAEPVKFLFLLEMGLLSIHANSKKIFNFLLVRLIFFIHGQLRRKNRLSEHFSVLTKKFLGLAVLFFLVFRVKGGSLELLYSLLGGSGYANDAKVL